MNLGLNVDIDHVGWSVTDENLKIATIKRQDMIGVRTFEVAETGEVRRLSRSAIRLRKRQKVNKKYIANIFRDEINKIDPLFFERIKKSDLFIEDGGFQTGLFPTKKESHIFYHTYPTMYHLIEAIKSGEETDVRAIYLAVSFLFKNRGHMHLGDLNPAEAIDFSYICYKFENSVTNVCHINLTKEHKDLIQSVLLANQSKTQKVKELMASFSLDKEKTRAMKALMTLMVGGKCQVMHIFPEETAAMQNDTDLANPLESTVLNADVDDFSAAMEPFLLYLSPDQVDVLMNTKNLYDWSQLTTILHGEQSISKAMVASYKKHKIDLWNLKNTFKYMEQHGFDNCYENMFIKKDGSPNNYACYVGQVIDSKKMSRSGLHRSTESFMKELTNILTKMKDALTPEDTQYTKISAYLEDIANDNFLCKQRDVRNRIIPNVLVADELRLVLEKAAEVYPFLNTKRESGYSAVEELIKIHKFSLPFWMGPVNDSGSYGWAVRKEPGHVYPWNINQKIDLEATRQKFIRSLINECALSAGETVLCDNSFYIRKLECLDELNKIRIDGDKLPVKAKQQIYNELTVNFKKVTQNAVVGLLYANGYLTNGETYEISGFTKKKLNHTLGYYIDANAVCEGLDTEVYEQLAEYNTVFKNDINLVFDMLKDQYEPSMLKKLLSIIKDNGWSIYSKHALTEVKAMIPGIDHPVNILDALYETDASLDELLGSNYTFMAAFDAENRKRAGNRSLSDIIEKTSTTPMVKRSLRQMVRVIKELKHFTKEIPEQTYLNIYVPNNMNVHKENIRKTILKAFDVKDAAKKKSLPKDILEENQLLLDKLKEIKTPLSKRQQLWFLQRGRCLYTGEKIPYESLFTSNSPYNIDHIYPKSKVYDESVTSNLCLVKKKENEDKDASYPINPNIQQNMQPFWDSLLNDGLMTQHKYDALCSKVGIPIEVKITSIDKLLLEHRKTALLAGNIIKTLLPGTEVIYVSNTCLNDFVKKYDLNEYNVINHFPEARRSYYIQIVGKVWRSIFGDQPRRYITDNSGYSINVWNYDSDFWKAKTGIQDVKAELSRVHIKETMMKIGNDKGPLSDETIQSALYMRKLTDYLPLSRIKQDATKYGAKTSLKIAYFAIIESNEGLSIEPIPIYVAGSIKSEADLVKYLKTLGLGDVKILVARASKYSILNVDGTRLYLRGKTGSSITCSCARTFIEKNESYAQKVFTYNRLQLKNLYWREHLQITEEKNAEQYMEFLDNYEKNYSTRPNSQCDALKTAFEFFKRLDFDQQCKVLEELYGLTASNRGSAFLSDLQYDNNGTIKAFPATCGTITISANTLKKATSIYFENESTTGLMKERIRLK